VTIVLIFIAGFAWSTLVAPWLETRRNQRRRVQRELDRVGRVTYPTARPINAVRRDPSPVPRRRKENAA